MILFARRPKLTIILLISLGFMSAHAWAKDKDKADNGNKNKAQKVSLSSKLVKKNMSRSVDVTKITMRLEKIDDKNRYVNFFNTTENGREEMSRSVWREHSKDEKPAGDMRKVVNSMGRDRDIAELGKVEVYDTIGTLENSDGSETHMMATVYNFNFFFEGETIELSHFIPVQEGDSVGQIISDKLINETFEESAPLSRGTFDLSTFTPSRINLKTLASTDLNCSLICSTAFETGLNICHTNWAITCPAAAAFAAAGSLATCFTATVGLGTPICIVTVDLGLALALNVCRGELQDCLRDNSTVNTACLRGCPGGGIQL